MVPQAHASPRIYKWLQQITVFLNTDRDVNNDRPRTYYPPHGMHDTTRSILPGRLHELTPKKRVESSLKTGNAPVMHSCRIKVASGPLQQAPEIVAALVAHALDVFNRQIRRHIVIGSYEAAGHSFQCCTQVLQRLGGSCKSTWQFCHSTPGRIPACVSSRISHVIIS